MKWPLQNSATRATNNTILINHLTVHNAIFKEYPKGVVVVTVGTEVDLVAEKVVDEEVDTVGKTEAVEIIILPQVSKENVTIVRLSRYGAYIPHNLQQINNQVPNTQNPNYPLQIGQVTPYLALPPILSQSQIPSPPLPPPSHQYPDVQGSIMGGQIDKKIINITRVDVPIDYLTL